MPVRALIEPSEVPPKDVGSKGIVAFAAIPVGNELERHKRVCEAFKATLIDQNHLKPNVPLSRQMITFWPVTNKNTLEAAHADCSYLTANYDLKSGLDAILDADRLKSGLK